jgi:site-specific DNA recombinase
MLRNERYKGVIVWNRTTEVRNPETGRKETRRRPESEWVRVNVPTLRIISDELWDRVQEQIRFVNEKWGFKQMGGFYRTKNSSTYLFSGLLVCGICGASMTIIGSDIRCGSNPVRVQCTSISRSLFKRLNDSTGGTRTAALGSSYKSSPSH